ncbi:hypothetical protein DTL42_18170 [Bremerella cremea]|uniref:Uncharacterized protein n=1 Tax=Bremerella cremea TaxID=1031537 RepID=A0A368KMT7_9BACT|nr:hypothetical protein DTL42_18170 [Bremerella cremea]
MGVCWKHFIWPGGLLAIKSIAPFLPFIVICMGCAHHQLGYQTVKQAHTVADVHTQQALDNLAKFVHNPNALPHFSYPSQGSSEVNETSRLLRHADV